MRESDWHKRVENFKRRIASALDRVTARFGHRMRDPAPGHASQREDDCTRVSVAEQQSHQIPPPPPSHPVEPARSRAANAPVPGTPPPRVELDRACDSLTSCQPAVDCTDESPVDDQLRIEDKSSPTASAESAVDGAQPNVADPAPNGRSILARLVPKCSVDATGIWLPETHQPSRDSKPKTSASRAAGRTRLPQSPPEVEVGTAQRLVAIADSENVFTPVTDTLRYAGVLKKDGELKRKVVQGLQIVHTGDMILKHQPDPAVAEYWLELGERVELVGGELILLAGNHELEIWDGLQQGQRLGMKRRQCEQVRAFIGNCRLFHVSGSVMLIHGYPTLNLLRRLKAFQDGTGLSIGHYNEQCFRPALDDPGELAHYRYLRGKGACKLLLHDLANADSYYRKHGRDVAALLRHFGINKVVHGHRPERSGVQADYEFRRWLPGIRMIGNDTQLAQRGLGAVIMRMESENGTEVLLVNTETAGDEQRKLVKSVLRNKSRRQPGLAALEFSRAGAAMAARNGRDKPSNMSAA